MISLILFLLLENFKPCSCFTFTPLHVRKQLVKSTRLNYSPPIQIIGPMIRRMREEQRKKEQPLATEEERLQEADGLRIGTGVWKWPPVWPYSPDLFMRKGEEPQSPMTNPMMMLATNMNGELPETPEVEKLDLMNYWGEVKKDVKTELHPDSIEKLKSHFSYYIKGDDISILEFGAAEDSYLPDEMKPSRHVGISLSEKLMSENPSLTESYVIDIDKVIPETGIDSDIITELGEDKFDVILISNTIDFLTNPREVFKSAWRLLKQGGYLFVAFTTKDAYSSKFSEAQTNQWRSFNDDQHMYVAGSFFHFSAGEGFNGLKGFDISPENVKADNGNFLSNAISSQSDKPQPMYVVQAQKGYILDTIDEDDPEEAFKSRMWMIPTLEPRDKILVAPRLARTFLVLKDQEILNQVPYLSPIYEALIKMDQFAFPFSLQSQLAADLISDIEFNANEEQLTALKMGLGLRKPSKSFWEPVGQLTAAMPAEEKVKLLSHLVPRFGSNDPSKEELLDDFVTGLKPVFQVIELKCPSLSKADVQTIGSELLAREILTGSSTKEEFAFWLNELSSEELEELSEQRKQIKTEAVAEMKEMQSQRQALIEEREERMKLMQSQVTKARKERTMRFNEETGKMEEVKS